MKFGVRVFIGCIMCILSIYVIFATCIDLVAFDRSFYNAKYEQLETYESIGTTKAGLYTATDTLLDYLKGYRDDINAKMVINQHEKEVFTQREKDHMVDVRYLYQDAMTLRNVFIIVIIMLGALLYADNKKEMKDVLSYSYQRVWVLFIFALVALMIYALADFTTFWTTFHKLFFTNDLWLLNPATSVMINMFPEPFFYAMVIRIAILFFMSLTLILGWSIQYRRKLLRFIK